MTISRIALIAIGVMIPMIIFNFVDVFAVKISSSRNLEKISCFSSALKDIGYILSGIVKRKAASAKTETATSAAVSASLGRELAGGAVALGARSSVFGGGLVSAADSIALRTDPREPFSAAGRPGR